MLVFNLVIELQLEDTASFVLKVNLDSEAAVVSHHLGNGSLCNVQMCVQ